MRTHLDDGHFETGNDGTIKRELVGPYGTCQWTAVSFTGMGMPGVVPPSQPNERPGRAVYPRL